MQHFRLQQILCQNRNKSMPCQDKKGLMNAAVFQREGEGFGSWVRDTCHAAFRCQNLLAGWSQGMLSIFLNMDLIMVLIVLPCRRLQHGDHYITTGDIQLFVWNVTWNYKICRRSGCTLWWRNAAGSCNHVLRRMLFEEPENGGYCLGTEIAFALTYQDVARI